MNLEYRGDSRIKIERNCPTKPNFCRLSVAANTVNYFRGENIFSPDEVLAIVNKERISSGREIVDPDKDFLTDHEIDEFIYEYGGDIISQPLEGGRYLNLDFWRDLVDAGYIIVPDYQLLHADPKNYVENDIGYLPPDLLHRLVHETEFSYQTFIDLYSFFIDRAGCLEDGHVEMVLDIQKINNLDSIIFANLVAVGNEYPFYIPWNLFRYLALEWIGPAITNINQFPDEESLRTIMDQGSLNVGRFNFFYGSLDIYHPQERKADLEAILEEHNFLCTA